MTINSLALFVLATFAFLDHLPRCLSQDKEQTSETALLYKAMIDQLASPNAKPKTHINGKPYKVRFPADYDVKSQELVDEASIRASRIDLS